MQSQFLNLIRQKSSNAFSFTEEIADRLNISYDAAHRRINGKTSLTFEEGITLAKHYNVSLNKLFDTGDQNSIITKVSPRPNNEKMLEIWFEQTLKSILPLTELKNAEIIYSAKDIPLFHTLNDSFLTRYRMYVWLKDVNLEMTKSKITFDEWMKRIPPSLLKSAYNLSEVYKHINIIEIWTDNTVTGMIQQVLYYFEAGLVSKEMAVAICDDIHKVVTHIEEQTIHESILGTKGKNTYHLYKCDLHMLNNTVMVKTPSKKIFSTLFTVLSYFKIEDQETCEVMYEFLKKLMSNSKLLATSGELDRALFFKTIHQKISKAKKRVNIDNKRTFM